VIQQINQFEETFKFFDENGDGEITKGELAKALAKLGYKPTPASIETLMNDYDRDNDGKITLNEFVDMMIQKAHRPPTPQCRRLLHSTKTKTASSQPKSSSLGMQQLGTQMTDEQIAAMIRAVDKDADGKVDFKEFSSNVSIINNLTSICPQRRCGTAISRNHTPRRAPH
jgi:Ca2+-binding EF-hand superfamily protein